MDYFLFESPVSLLKNIRFFCAFEDSKEDFIQEIGVMTMEGGDGKSPRPRGKRMLGKAT